LYLRNSRQFSISNLQNVHLGVESSHVRSTGRIPVQSNGVRIGAHRNRRAVEARQSLEDVRSKQAIVDGERVAASVRLEECDLHLRPLLVTRFEQNIVASTDSGRLRIRGREHLLSGRVLRLLGASSRLRVRGVESGFGAHIGKFRVVAVNVHPLARHKSGLHGHAVTVLVVGETGHKVVVVNIRAVRPRVVAVAAFLDSDVNSVEESIGHGSSSDEIVQSLIMDDSQECSLVLARICSSLPGCSTFLHLVARVGRLARLQQVEVVARRG
ncbi:hypothetical protein PFISCL1PPCAC_23479, partial [Pristionchus fissidentatus]